MAKNLFNSIKLTRPKKNVFDLTHDVKLSLNMGELVPIMCTEAVPGDKFKISAESILRFAPLIAPVMHRMDVSIHYFFVPNRILWPNWENYITSYGYQDPSPAFPTVATINGPTQSRLMDYLGIPQTNAAMDVNALPLAAYQKIYNEYYRDQNLQAIVDWQLADGSNAGIAASLRTLRKRDWEHDYFTSALPFAQKGSAVDVPLGDVTLKEDWLTDNQIPRMDSGFGPITNQYVLQTGEDGGVPRISTENMSEYPNPFALDPNGSLEVGATTINDLRRAFRLQEWLEKNARGGTRYIESILSHFGVRSSDKRLQRPEYITGVKSPVVVSEVVNTTGTDELPQGNLAGHAISVTAGKGGGYYCEEHGYIMGIMSVMPKTAYQQGIPKHFTKYVDPFQFYWPEFSNIGEQEIIQKELYANSATPNATFGYVPRYAEYKFENNRVAGDFRTTLDYWHLGRIFSSDPALNAQFVEANPDTRIFAVEDPDVQKLYCHVLNKVRAVRPMPKFGTPSF